jgi:serine/threonine protein kinase
VISGRVPDFRSDVFSLGVIFYEMLTGVNPFRRSTLAETFASILSEHPSPPEESNPRVPAELGRVVLRMLAKDPGLRYATPADLLDDFRQAVEGASVAIARSAGRRARVVALLVAAVVLIAALLLVMWVAERSPR